jgi:hypothetical protein
LIILEYETKNSGAWCLEAHYIYRWAMIFHCLRATTWLYGTARYVCLLAGLLQRHKIPAAVLLSHVHVFSLKLNATVSKITVGEMIHFRKEKPYDGKN